MAAFFPKGNKGAQVNFLQYRPYKVISPLKCSSVLTRLLSARAMLLRERTNLTYFTGSVKLKKHLLLIRVTTYEAKLNRYAIGLIKTEVALEELFLPDCKTLIGFERLPVSVCYLY